MGRLKRSPLWDDPRVKPPFGAAEIDWGHPLAQGLRWLWLCNERGGPARTQGWKGRQGNNTFSLVNGASWRGEGILLDGSNDYIYADTAFSLQAVGATHDVLTYVAVIRPTTIGAARYTIFTANDEAGATVPMLEIGDGSGGTRRVAVIKPGVWMAETGNNVVTAGTRHVIVYVRSGSVAGSQFIYVDGVPMTLGTDVNSSVAEGVASRPILGARSTTPTQAFSGTIESFGIWRSPHTAGMARQIATEPYCMLRPVIRRRYFVPVAALLVSGPRNFRRMSASPRIFRRSR